jgi:hypothetical protein
MTDHTQTNVVPINITEQEAVQFVKDALKSEGLLHLTRHAKERMAERNISMAHIRNVLEHGQITEGPIQDTKGSWSCRFEGYAAGEGLGVAVGFGFKNGVQVVVITAFKRNNYR